jgi:hypothetical protein
VKFTQNFGSQAGTADAKMKHYAIGYPFMMDISRATSFANFCSSACRDKGRVAAMAVQGVPIPTEPPVCDPVESCAICNGAVDMHEWHLTYTESAYNEDWQTIEEVEYLAVVCPTCEARLVSTL